MSVKPDELGRSFVRFQQVYAGRPDHGRRADRPGRRGRRRDLGQRRGAARSGRWRPSRRSTPRRRAQTALEKIAKEYGLAVEELTASEPALWIYNPAHPGRAGPAAQLAWSGAWRSRPRQLLPIRELVLVDAGLGNVALQLQPGRHARNRRIYDNQNMPRAGLPGTGPVRTEGGPATGIADADNGVRPTPATPTTSTRPTTAATA